MSEAGRPAGPGRLVRAAERAVYTARNYAWAADPRTLRPRAVPVDRPVFLLSVQGGGLTLVSRMLRRHPDVVAAGGGSRAWTSSDELQNVFGPILPFELTGLRFKAPPHPVLGAPRSWTYAARELFPVYRRRPSDATPELRRALVRVIRASLTRHGGRRFVDKSQVFCVRLGMLDALLDGTDPRFVVLARDPYVSVARAASGRAADLRRLADALGREGCVDVAAEHWANSMRAALDDAEACAAPVRVVRFEDVVADPEARLRELCEFVELDFRPSMLPSPDDTLPFGSRYRDRWYPIRESSGFEDVDDFVVERVNAHAADVAQRLGYELR